MDQLTALSALPTSAVIYEKAMCAYLHRSPRTLKRAVQRGEIPPPFRLLGRPAWRVGELLEHFRVRQLEAQQYRADDQRRVAVLRP